MPSNVKDVATRLRLVLTGGPSTATRMYFSNDQSTYAPAPGSNNGAGMVPVAGSLSGSPYEDRSFKLYRGTSQTHFVATASGVGSKRVYNGRFTSPPLAAQSVASGVWILGIAAGSGSLSNAEICPQVYVWRPSTSTVVARIRNVAGTSLAIGNSANDSEQGYVSSMTNLNGGQGPAFNTLDGDVIVFEDWWIGSQGTIGTRNRHIWFGGTTDVVNAVAPTNAASYLHAPQALTFLNPGDVKTRVRVAAGPIYKDVQMLVYIKLRGFADVATRTGLVAVQYADIATRTVLEPGPSYKDVALRLVARPLAYQDVQVRKRLANWTYKDVAVRALLQAATRYKDVATRTRLTDASYKDVAIRLGLEDPGWQGLILLDDNAEIVWWLGEGF